MKPIEPPERIDNQPLIEMSLIESIRTAEQLQKLESIGPEWMMFGPAYRVVVEYYTSTGEIPPVGLLASRYGDWAPQAGDFTYWFEQYKRIRVSNNGKPILEKAIRLLDGADPVGALSNMVGEIQAIGTNAETMAIPIDYMIWERLEQYKRRVEDAKREGVKMLGMPSGFAMIDRTKIGWQESEMVGILARPAIGKTWFLIRQAVIGWMTGRRVLIISTEMSEPEITARFDTLVAGHNEIMFYHHMVQTLDENMIPNIEKLANLLRPEHADGPDNKRIWVRDHRLTVAQIDAAASFYKADVVLIDGITQLTSKLRNGQAWEQMKDIAYDLRDMALRRGCICIVTHQSINKNRGKKTTDETGGRGDDWMMPTINDAAYGDAFAQACSTVITVAPDQNHRNLRWYSVRKTRERGEIDTASKAPILWDVDRGIIRDLIDCGMSEDKIRIAMRQYGVPLGA